MKKLTLMLIVATSIFTACNSSSSNEKDTKTDSAAATSSTSDKASAGSISCNIDGKAVSYPVPGFTEVALDPNSNGTKDGVLFGDPSATKEGFQLEIKNNGTSKIARGGGGDILCVINYYKTGGVVYTAVNITANVVSFDHKHLTGTFSGQLVNSLHYSPAGKEKEYPDNLNVTDGKFDIQQ